MTRTIFIHYETKTREFDGKLLLITNLLKYHNKIYFGHYSSIKKHALKSSNGIIILKSLTKYEVNFYKQLKKRGFLIVLLHAEGGIHYKDNQDTILSFFNPSLLEYVDYNFVYGEAVRNDIIKYCGNRFAKNTIVTGEPRFDLLKPEYISFFNDEIKMIKKDYGDFILINTSFSAANPSVGINRFLEVVNSEPTYTDKTKQLIIEKTQFLSEVLPLYIEAIKYAAKVFPKINFVIRPHPSESDDFYKNNFNSFQNIYVTKRNNVANWIIASKGVVHYDCTTGMEAVLAQKPVISYLPKQSDKILAWLPVELSKKTFNKEELIGEIKNILEDTFNFQINDSVLQIWKKSIHNVDNISSDIILSALQSNHDEFINYRSDDHIFNLRLLFKKIYERLSILKNNIRNRNNIEKQKFGVLSKHEVISKINNLKDISKINFDFYVKEIHNDLVFIGKKTYN